MGVKNRAFKICLLGLLWCNFATKRKRYRRWKVHPLHKKRNSKGEFRNLSIELEKYPMKYYQYFRMGKDRFEFLLEKIESRLTGNITTPKEKLCITLKYLATGESMTDLATRFRMGTCSIRKYILQTLDAIIEVMMPITMPQLRKEQWTRVAKDFYNRWNFPNCLGATDGKHCDLFCPAKSGSRFFNYKNRFSINLMSVVDATYKFIMIDVGGEGSNHDTTVFWNTDFDKMWYNQCAELQLPSFIPLPGTQDVVPYQLIADDAFGQSTTVMTPFPGRYLSQTQRIFNYRLSRARRMVESAFGILVHTWRILLKRIEVSETFAKKIVRASCCLHNFLRMSRRDLFNMNDEQDTPTPESNPVPTTNRTTIETNRSSRSALEMREKFANWCINEGNVAFQYKMI